MKDILISYQKKIFKNPLFSGSVVMFGGSMGINVVNYLYHLIMGRILGPVGYGVLASVFSLLYIVSIVPLSTSISIVKFISSAKTDKELSGTYHGIKSFVFKLSAVLLVILILFSLPIANFLNIEDKFSVFFVGPIMYFSIITLVNQATAQGLLNFLGFIIPNLVSSVGKLLFGLLFVFIGFSVGGAVGGILIAMIFGYVVSVLLIKSNIKNSVGYKFDSKAFIKYSLPVLLQAFAFTSIFSIDLLLAKHFLSPLEAGVYASLSTLGKIIYFATSPISSVMFPIISKKHSQKVSYKKMFTISLFLTTGISIFITFVYFLFPQYAIGLLFGKSYLQGSSNLIWMGVFMVFYSVSYLIVNYFLAIGKIFIVVFPIIASVVQVILIYGFFHSSTNEIIQVSLWVSVLLTASLLLLLKNEKFT